MDFIDDFIQEYKNNPCLWKANSVYFKNRTKRQEAYLKLIDVAAKHGEHYNVERTKQKINNLRCAFRHQLKKYVEFKNKGKKEEPYCPKRRYFESLMFLKDEENPKLRNVALNENSKDIIIDILATDNLLDHGDCKKIQNDECIENDVSLESNVKEISNKLQENFHEKVTTAISDFERRSVIHSENAVECDDDKSINMIQTSRVLSPNLDKYVSSKVFDFNKESRERSKKRKCRKRSSSLSSQFSNESLFNPPKSLKVGLTAIDFDKLFAMAIKSVHSNTDDHFTSFGKIIAHKLRSMEPVQAIFAEKIIGDVLFQGQMKLLSALSINQFLTVDSPNSYEEIQSNK